METPNKGLLLGAAALAALAVVVIGSAVLGSDGDGTPDPQSPSSSVTRVAAGEPSTPSRTDGPDDTSSPPATYPTPSDPTTTRGADPEPRSPKAARDLAEQAVVLYTEYSYTDAGPYAWMDRIGKVSTGSFSHMLEETFGGDQELERYWDEVVETERQTRTEVESVALERVFADYARDRMTFAVTYRTAVSTTETDGWTDPPRALSQWVTVVKAGGDWKVADITTTQNRS